MKFETFTTLKLVLLEYATIFKDQLTNNQLLKISSNSGSVSINGGKIYLNLKLGQMIYLKNVHYLAIGEDII